MLQCCDDRERKNALCMCVCECVLTGQRAAMRNMGFTVFSFHLSVTSPSASTDTRPEDLHLLLVCDQFLQLITHTHTPPLFPCQFQQNQISYSPSLCFSPCIIKRTKLLAVTTGWSTDWLLAAPLQTKRQRKRERERVRKVAMETVRTNLIVSLHLCRSGQRAFQLYNLSVSSISTHWPTSV